MDNGNDSWTEDIANSFYPYFLSSKIFSITVSSDWEHSISAMNITQLLSSQFRVKLIGRCLAIQAYWTLYQV